MVTNIEVAEITAPQIKFELFDCSFCTSLFTKGLNKPPPCIYIYIYTRQGRTLTGSLPDDAGHNDDNGNDSNGETDDCC